MYNNNTKIASMMVRRINSEFYFVWQCSVVKLISDIKIRLSLIASWTDKVNKT